MPFKGPRVPHRTSRSIALDHGTNLAGFDGSEYVPQVGVPKGTRGAELYKEQPLAVGASPSPHPTPFKLGDGK